MKRRLLSVLLLALLLFSLLATPVFALTPTSPSSLSTSNLTSAQTPIPVPDSPGLSISNYTAYENTYVAGDTLILLEYHIPYATLPSNSAAINFIIRYIDPNGNTLTSVVPYAYTTLGYGYGAAALYFDPSVGPVWDESGSIQISGNPAVIWAAGTISNGTTGVISTSPTTLVAGSNTTVVTTLGDLTVVLPSGSSGVATGADLAGSPVSLPSGTTTLTTTATTTLTLTLNGYAPSESVPMMTTSWSSSTTVAQGRYQVCDNLIHQLAVDLEGAWNVSLTAQSSTGTVLSATYGQQYFSNVIPYFETICSSILTVTQALAVKPPPPAAYNTSYQETLQKTWTSPDTLWNGTTLLTTMYAGTTTVTVPAATLTVQLYPGLNGDAAVSGTVSGTAGGGTATLSGDPVTLTTGGTTTLVVSAPGTLVFNLTGAILGSNIAAAAFAQGISTDMWLFGAFIIIAIFALSFVALKLEQPGAVPLIFIPIFVGGIKIGVVPMDVGVTICALLFIISMYLLIHRRAAV